MKSIRDFDKTIETMKKKLFAKVACIIRYEKWTRFFNNNLMFKINPKHFYWKKGKKKTISYSKVCPIKNEVQEIWSKMWADKRNTK